MNSSDTDETGRDGIIPQEGENMDGMKKTQRMATIYDGHSHIERRVYIDECGTYYVRINGFFAKVADLRRVNHFDVDVWYDG